MGEGASANQVAKGHDDYNYGTVRGRTPRERIYLLKEEGWCTRCGRHPYDRNNECWAASAQCFACYGLGHLSYLCPET